MRDLIKFPVNDTITFGLVRPRVFKNKSKKALVDSAQASQRVSRYIKRPRQIIRRNRFQYA